MAPVLFIIRKPGERTPSTDCRIQTLCLLLRMHCGGGRHPMGLLSGCTASSDESNRQESGLHTHTHTHLNLTNWWNVCESGWWWWWWWWWWRRLLKSNQCLLVTYTDFQMLPQVQQIAYLQRTLIHTSIGGIASCKCTNPSLEHLCNSQGRLFRSSIKGR